MPKRGIYAIVDNIKLRKNYNWDKNEGEVYPEDFCVRIMVVCCLGLLLGACSSAKVKLPAYKAFTYNLSEPVRPAVSTELAEHLAGASPQSLSLTLDDGRLVNIDLGGEYYSANGYRCRHYGVNTDGNLYEGQAACLIAGEWRQAMPILINKN